MSRFKVLSYRIYRTICSRKSSPTDSTSKFHFGSAYYMFVVDYQKPRGRRKWPHWFRIMVTDDDILFFKDMIEEYQQSSGVTLNSFKEFLARSVSRYSPVARGEFFPEEWAELEKWELEHGKQVEE